MFKATLAAFVACISMQASAYVNRFPTYDPQYIFDGQYTAALQQRAHHWRLLPLRGEQVEVAENCRNSASVPKGLWYVSPDAQGKLQLIAPSVTTLPTGFPERVALRSCGEQSTASATLFVPTQALDWIGANAGTVLIDD
jgi:hypothetical protein